MEIPKSLDTMRELTNRPFDEWEQKRYSLERRIVLAAFIDRCLFPAIKSGEKVLSLAKELCEAQKTDFIKMCTESYENFDKNRKEFYAELEAHTKTVFDI